MTSSGMEFYRYYIQIQLLDEVEHDTENYHAEVWCYLPKPKAEADNTMETEAVKIKKKNLKNESP